MVVRLRGPQVADQGPFRQLANGDEGDGGCVADELAGQAVRCSPAEQRGCDIGVEDDEAHAMSARRDA
jgi:hypothetical protein